MTEREQWDAERRDKLREEFLVRVQAVRAQLQDEPNTMMNIAVDGILAETIAWLKNA